MKILRARVYDAIDTERDYQESLLKEGVHKTEVPPLGNEIATLEEIVARARGARYDGENAAALELMRKAAAVAVRCMENHGAPERAIPGQRAPGKSLLADVLPFHRPAEGQRHPENKQ